MHQEYHDKRRRRPRQPGEPTGALESEIWKRIWSLKVAGTDLVAIPLVAGAVISSVVTAKLFSKIIIPFFQWKPRYKAGEIPESPLEGITDEDLIDIGEITPAPVPPPVTKPKPKPKPKPVPTAPTAPAPTSTPTAPLGARPKKRRGGARPMIKVIPRHKSTLTITGSLAPALRGF